MSFFFFFLHLAQNNKAACEGMLHGKCVIGKHLSPSAWNSVTFAESVPSVLQGCNFSTVL